jgi:PPK2 family polyphosphate:nucleotide phosphotransferase
MGLSKYRVTGGKGFELAKFDTGPGDKPLFAKEERLDVLATNVELIRALQDKLYAEGKASVLVIFQGMDGAGKDGVIRNVIRVNPQGVKIHSFKQPSRKELAHDFLWRAVKCLPELGMMGVFNRSYYEDVLIVAVRELYKHLNVLDRCKDENTIKRRFEQIRNFEKHLWESGTIVIKVFLHLSRDEQRKRFLSRIDEDSKNWKFTRSDMAERELWTEYQEAFEAAIKNTSTEKAPWWVVPADSKKYARAVVSEILLKALEKIDPHYPPVTDEHKKELQECRKVLLES